VARIRHSAQRHLLRNLAAPVLALAIPVAAASAAHAATMSQWDNTALKESGGDWSINYSSDGLSVGGLQFQAPSWNAALDYLASLGFNVASWNRNLHQGMPRSQVPGKDETILAGEALLHIQGAGAWANGNASGSVSMFDGGPNPWGLPGIEVPPGLGAGSSSPSTPIGNSGNQPGGGNGSFRSSRDPSDSEPGTRSGGEASQLHKCHDRPSSGDRR
jgi:hypothetical protein